MAYKTAKNYLETCHLKVLDAMIIVRLHLLVVILMEIPEAFMEDGIAVPQGVVIETVIHNQIKIQVKQIILSYIIVVYVKLDCFNYEYIFVVHDCTIYCRETTS